MAKGWPTEAEQDRRDALEACATIIDLCNSARQLRGYTLRAQIADISRSVSELRRALFLAQAIRPASGQWPKVAKARLDLALMYAQWMVGKIEILRGADSDPHAIALLAELADLAAGIQERIETI